MTQPLVVGVDGGNTKTVAAVATTTGQLLGTGAGGCTDVYGAPSEEEALTTLARVVKDALSAAGAEPRHVVATVASLAGADWPEDYELYRSELRARVGLGGSIVVVNDGVGPVRLAGPAGTGVAVVVGTGAAVGSRGPEGRIWHGSFWLPGGGVGWLGQRALDAVSRAALGLAPPTSLSARLLRHFEVEDEQALLYKFTRRPHSAARETWRQEAGAIVLDADGSGDEVARGIVSRSAEALAPFVVLAAEKVGITGDFMVVLTGGLIRHPTTTLARSLRGKILGLNSNADVVTTNAPPVAGALLEAVAVASHGVSDEVFDAVTGSPVLARLSRRPGVLAEASNGRSRA